MIGRTLQKSTNFSKINQLLLIGKSHPFVSTYTVKYFLYTLPEAHTSHLQNLGHFPQRTFFLKPIHQLSGVFPCSETFRGGGVILEARRFYEFTSLRIWTVPCRRSRMVSFMPYYGAGMFTVYEWLIFGVFISCRYIYHTWMLWVRFSLQNFCFCSL